MEGWSAGGKRRLYTTSFFQGEDNPYQEYTALQDTLNNQMENNGGGGGRKGRS